MVSVWADYSTSRYCACGGNIGKYGQKHDNQLSSQGGLDMLQVWSGYGLII